MQDMIYKALPYIVLDYEDNLVAWSLKWTGFVPSPEGEFNTRTRQDPDASSFWGVGTPLGWGTPMSHEEAIGWARLQSASAS